MKVKGKTDVTQSEQHVVQCYKQHDVQLRKGILIAAPKSGSGKTLVTCALIQALRNQKVRVCSYKSGPDYIDPMFHRIVLGVPGGNLDTFFTGEEKTKELFCKQTSEDNFAVVEGVMGLYDGMGGIKEEGSSYHLAKTLNLPVILVVDAHGMGRSILPLLAGFLLFDSSHRIKGVILNRVSKSFFPVLKDLIEQVLEIEVFGFFPEQKDLHLESRHLGLKMPEEIAGLKEQVQKAAMELEKTVDVGRIYELGVEQSTLFSALSGKKQSDRVPVMNSKPIKETRPVLAVARDEAFCFYYQENLQLFEDAGFRLVEFSPMHDTALPSGTNAIFLGGGYPELFAKELASNEKMKAAIKEAIAAGTPSIAECGGFMYLHESLTDKDGNTYKMTGVVDGNCSYQGKLVRFGYVEIKEQNSIFLPAGEDIKGHEFHYFDSTNNGTGCVARKPVGTKKWECIWEEKDHWWGFPHLYYPSNENFVTYFRKIVMEKTEDK